MSVKLTHLIVLYGVAGAREKFEDLAVELIRSERPEAERVRVVVGDGGLDAHEGSLVDPDGVDVFQVKFFPDGLGESQKDQIRKSFAKVKDGTACKVKSWTLCLPVDLSVDEKKWFDGWREKQQEETGIEIKPVWGETKLLELLYDEKNRGLKEEFFKEEHLAQVREMHDTLGRLLDEICRRLPGPVPLVLRPHLCDVRPRHSYDFDSDFAVVEVKLCFEVENVSPQSVANWSIKCTLNLPDTIVLSKKTFPKLGSGSSPITLNSTILPTCSHTTEIIFGLKVRRSDPLDAQVRGILEPAEATFWAVSDNHVGERLTVPLRDKIDWHRLLEGMKDSLQKGNVEARY